MSLYQRVVERNEMTRRAQADTGQGTQMRALMQARDQSDWARQTEFGLIMSPEGEKQLKSRMIDIEAQMAKAQKEIADAKAKVAEEQGSLDKKWGDFSGGFIDVNVVDGNSIEHTYKLPKELAREMYAKSFNQGEGTYTALWLDFDDGNAQLNVDVTPRGTDEKYGKELHETFMGAEKQVYDAFYDKAGQALKEATANATRQINDYEKSIAETEAHNKKMLEGYQTKQKEDAADRTETSNALFGGSTEATYDETFNKQGKENKGVLD